VRENRTHGSEGGDGATVSDPYQVGQPNEPGYPLPDQSRGQAARV
jgi:hypothetical protein